MLGLGHSLVAGSALGGYENNFGLKFDGTNDGALAGISGQSPANGTIKPLSPSGFTVAAWCKLDIDGDDNPYADSGTYRIVNCAANGGWSLHYANGRFSFGMKIVDGDGNTANTVAVSEQPFMKNLLTGTGQPKQYLHKPDGWHFVVGTWDGDRIKNIYVDGGRELAGSSTIVSEGVGNFGSQPEDSGSKKTESASSGGAWTIKYDADTGDRDEIDVTIGASSNFSSLSDVTSPNSEFWEGYIGDVGVWDKELTSAEVTTLYNLHRPIDFATVQPDNLQGHWKMEEGSGTVFVESTGNVGTDGTISGATFDALAPSTDVSGYAGYQ